MNVDIVNKQVIFKIKAFVESESEDGQFYCVTADQNEWKCSCPNFNFRDAQCKHIMAVREEIDNEEQ